VRERAAAEKAAKEAKDEAERDANQRHKEVAAANKAPSRGRRKADVSVGASEEAKRQGEKLESIRVRREAIAAAVAAQRAADAAEAADVEEKQRLLAVSDHAQRRS
jgi:hypothetical protein